MKKLGVYCAATVGAMAVTFSSLAFLSTGVAAADDYAGQTYGDAVGAIKDAGKKVVISSRSGNAPAGDDCLVTHSELAPWLQRHVLLRGDGHGAARFELQRQGRVGDPSGQLRGQPGGQGGTGGAEEGGGQEGGGKEAAAHSSG